MAYVGVEPGPKKFKLQKPLKKCNEFFGPEFDLGIPFAAHFLTLTQKIRHLPVALRPAGQEIEIH